MFVVKWNKCPNTGFWRKQKEFDCENKMLDFITDHLTPSKQRYTVEVKGV